MDREKLLAFFDKNIEDLKRQLDEAEALRASILQQEVTAPAVLPSPCQISLEDLELSFEETSSARIEYNTLLRTAEANLEGIYRLAADIFVLGFENIPRPEIFVKEKVGKLLKRKVERRLKVLCMMLPPSPVKDIGANCITLALSEAGSLHLVTGAYHTYEGNLRSGEYKSVYVERKFYPSFDEKMYENGFFTRTSDSWDGKKLQAVEPEAFIYHAREKRGGEGWSSVPRAEFSTQAVAALEDLFDTMRAECSLHLTTRKQRVQCFS